MYEKKADIIIHHNFIFYVFVLKFFRIVRKKLEIIMIYLLRVELGLIMDGVLSDFGLL